MIDFRNSDQRHNLKSNQRHNFVPLQNGRFLKLWSSDNLAEHRLEPIFDDSKPRDKRSVHRDKSSQE